MEHLPPVGWADVATKRDLDGLGRGLQSEIEALRRELRAEFRAELHAALNAQTKTLFFGLGGLMTAMVAGAAAIGQL